MNDMKSKDIIILFLSCDKYRDLWKPLFYCFGKFWKNCPYPLRLGSNTISYHDSHIQTILSGPDDDWSSSLQSILKQIDTPYVFLWLDDIFPIAPVDAHRFTEALNFMKRVQAKHVHIEAKPSPDTVIENGTYGVYERGAPYRVTSFGFWEVSALKDLLLAGESPWNFEIMGSYRSSYTDGYYCMMKNFIPRLHVVEKGKIFKDAYEYCIKNRIPLSKDSRLLLSNAFRLKSEIQKIYFNVVVHISWKFRLKFMILLRKLLISY